MDTMYMDIPMGQFEVFKTWPRHDGIDLALASFLSPRRNRLRRHEAVVQLVCSVVICWSLYSVSTLHSTIPRYSTIQKKSTSSPMFNISPYFTLKSPTRYWFLYCEAPGRSLFSREGRGLYRRAGDGLAVERCWKKWKPWKVWCQQSSTIRF